MTTAAVTIDNRDYDHMDGGFYTICDKCKQVPSTIIMDSMLPGAESKIQYHVKSSDKGEIYYECMNCNRTWVDEWHKVKSTELGTIENYEEKIKSTDPEILKQIHEGVERTRLEVFAAEIKKSGVPLKELGLVEVS